MCGKNQQVRTLYPATFNEKAISSHVYSARRLPDKIHYKILKCERCGLIFSSPVFSPKKLAKLYRKSFCNYKDKIPYLIKTYIRIIKEAGGDLPKNPKVLEVGCGNGFFLKALLDLNFTNDAFGVEPSSKMALDADPNLQKNIKIDFFKSNLFPKNSFDLILCFHTLDHMFDPKEFVEAAFSMLRKNGKVVVVVHDTEGLSVKIFGEKSAIFDIEHIYLFNKKTLREIFASSGFKVIKVFNFANSYPLSYWVQMSGFSNAVKKFAKFIFNVMKIYEREASVSAGNIALIAKKNV